MITSIVTILALLIAGVLVLAAARPDEFRVQRSFSAITTGKGNMQIVKSVPSSKIRLRLANPGVLAGK